MKVLLICLLLCGCATHADLERKFPDPPPELMTSTDAKLEKLSDIKNKNGKVLLSDVYGIIADNYLTCNKWKNQLDLLQEWINETKRNIETK